MALPVYRGPFKAAQAERLLWRAGFGPKKGDAARQKYPCASHPNGLVNSPGGRADDRHSLGPDRLRTLLDKSD